MTATKNPLPASQEEELFFNEDISWLRFNSRVLNEAVDKRTPLCERIKFCDIFRSNNDEFFQKRVGVALKRLNSPYASERDIKNVKELLEQISQTVVGQVEILSKVFIKELVPELEAQGIKLETWKNLSPQERKELVVYFKKDIFPILTPLAVDAGHPFPFLSNLSKSIGVLMRKPRSLQKLFARVKIPDEIPQWIKIAGNDNYGERFINIEEVIRNNLDTLFSGMEIEANMIFRVTRYASSREDGSDSDDLKLMVEEGLRERRFAPIVRVEYEEKPNFWILNFLQEELKVDDLYLFKMPSLASYSSLFSLYAKIKRPDLRYSEFKPGANEECASPNIFQAIRKKDHLIHFPYQSFSSSIENFIKTASVDPKVRAIKIIFYRTDEEGTLINALIQAAEKGKQVACIIELKARFDEEANIQWAKKLEKAGIYVTYGLSNHKTHAKIIMIVRQDRDGIRTYINVGTGNYNPQTSKIYVDLSFFTCKKNVSEDALEIFNFLTGRSLKHNYKSLLVAPFNMFDRFIDLINKEMAHHKEKGNGMIIVKLNTLDDQEMIRALYRASQAGVKVILIVRGICVLRPGVKGLSENIEVYSLVGRLLEHSRLYFFNSGEDSPEDGKFFIGSADWKHDSLFKRVELVVPIEQKDLRLRLWNILQLLLGDNRHLWKLRSDGSYEQRKPGKSAEKNAQATLIKQYEVQDEH